MLFNNWRQSLLSMVATGCGVITATSVFADHPFETAVLNRSDVLVSNPFQLPPSTIQQVGCFDGNCCEPECGCEAPGCDDCSDGGCDGATAKKKKEELAAKVAGAYKGLYYLNDFSYINDPCYKEALCGDRFKQIAGPGGSKIDLGGEIRTRFHSEENHSTPGLGLTGNGDPVTGEASRFWLTRLRLFGNWKINDCLRFYGEMIHADMGGFEHHRPRPIEVNRHDIQNLFFDVKLFDNDGASLTFRPGRQELAYGAQRMVSPLDWANTRRTFDGFKAMGTTKNWSVDGFWVNPMNRPVGQNFHHNDLDEANDDVKFYGVYAGRKGLKGGAALDLFYLGLNNQAGANDFSYHTLGGRSSGTVGDSDVKYELEAGYQFGTETDGSNHSAGAITAGLGRQMAIHDTFKPIVWFWYDWASGGDQAGQGWHHFFPLAHKYNGLMDLFGRRNLHDINAQFILPVNKRVKLMLWYHYFMMDQATAPSSVTMATFGGATNALGNPGGETELGHEWDLTATMALSNRQSVLLGYSYFDSGKFFTNPANTVPFRGDAQFAYCQWHYHF